MEETALGSRDLLHACDTSPLELGRQRKGHDADHQQAPAGRGAGADGYQPVLSDTTRSRPPVELRQKRLEDDCAGARCTPACTMLEFMKYPG